MAGLVTTTLIGYRAGRWVESVWRVWRSWKNHRIQQPLLSLSTFAITRLRSISMVRKRSLAHFDILVGSSTPCSPARKEPHITTSLLRGTADRTRHARKSLSFALPHPTQQGFPVVSVVFSSTNADAQAFKPKILENPSRCPVTLFKTFLSHTPPETCTPDHRCICPSTTNKLTTRTAKSGLLVLQKADNLHWQGDEVSCTGNQCHRKENEPLCKEDNG